MTMITPEKIEEWLKEAEERPASMAVILQYVANRLRDMTARNEELRAENLALRTEKRVEEYEQRITHLEYQLALLRRQFGGDATGEWVRSATAAQMPTVSVLLYDAQGRILRTTCAADQLVDGAELTRLAQPPSVGENAPRLLAVVGEEELIFVYSSGRIATLAVESIPSAAPLDWQQAALPLEPSAGETLACLAPIAHLALADFIVQVSRRGFVKKLMTSLVSSLFSKHYIGSGVTIPGDHTHTLALCGKDERLVLVSRAGYLLGLEVRDLPFSAEEALRMTAVDGLAAAFACRTGQALVVMTQLGKLLHWSGERLEVSRSLKSKGQSLYSAQRRERGVRVVGAAALTEDGWGVALHSDGRLTAHSLSRAVAAGAIESAGEVVDFAALPVPTKSSGSE